ncbi:MAG: tetratricopeptide repeat protein, partial [Candidatus Sulfotelmatobacter sp.]
CVQSADMVPTLRYLPAAIVLLLGVSPCFAQSANGTQQQFREHVLKARGYLTEKRPDLAIPELQAAAALDPQDVDTQGNLGVLLYFDGKAAEAIPHLRVALKEQPSLVKIQGILGIAELRTADFAQGRKDLEASFPLIQDPKFKVEVGLELVGLYTQSEDLDLAAAILAQLKKTAPDNPEVLYASYRTFSDLSSEAMISLSVVAPDSAQMHQLLAHLEIWEGNTNAAVAQFRKAIEIDPRLPGVQFELADLLNISQDPAVKKEAEREYGEALAADPRDEKAIFRLAEIAAQKGDTQQAYAGYTRALALQPADSDAKLGLAKILTQMNQPAKAQALLEQTVQLDPTNATAHYRLATFYREQGRMDDAKRELEQYKDLREAKDKLHAVYKDLLRQPAVIKADEPDEK